MKYIQLFENFKSLTDDNFNTLKGMLGKVKNEIENAKTIGNKRVEPSKEFENLSILLKRIGGQFSNLNLDINNLTFWSRARKAIHNIIELRDIRQAAEMRKYTYKVLQSFQEEFANFINKKQHEVNKYKNSTEKEND
jgi:hypothetical protein